MDGFEEYEKFDSASFEYIDPIKEYEKPINEQSMTERVGHFVENKMSFFNKKTLMCCGIFIIILIILFFLYKKYYDKNQIIYKLAP